MGSTNKYCYKCKCEGRNKFQPMDYDPSKGKFGRYTCHKCGYTVDQKTKEPSNDDYA